MTQPDQKPTLTVAEAAELLGVSRGLAYDLVRRGEIPSIRLGRRLLVPRHALELLLGEPSVGPADAEPTAAASLESADGGTVTAYLCIPVTIDKSALPTFRTR